MQGARNKFAITQQRKKEYIKTAVLNKEVSEKTHGGIYQKSKGRLLAVCQGFKKSINAQIITAIVTICHRRFNVTAAQSKRIKRLVIKKTIVSNHRLR